MLNLLKSQKGQNKNESGFTLIELLVVILIIGILAAIAVPIFLGQRKAANDTVLKTDIKSVTLSQESFLVKNPLAAGTIDKNELKITASRLSNETVIGVWVVDHVGYCVVGYNKNSDHSGGTGELNYMWYDSALGGFTTPTNDSTPPVGGACQSPRPSLAKQVWFNTDGSGVWL